MAFKSDEERRAYFREYNKGWYHRQITNEIEKCDVVCVNCHAKRHWREVHETDGWEEVIPLEE